MARPLLNAPFSYAETLNDPTKSIPPRGGGGMGRDWRGILLLPVLKFYFLMASAGFLRYIYKNCAEKYYSLTLGFIEVFFRVIVSFVSILISVVSS